MAGMSTGRDLHVDIPLSQIAMRYRPMGMIADLIAPTVDVNKQSDSYYVWSLSDVLRVVDDYRAPGEEARTMTRSISTDTYFADNYALKLPLVYEDKYNVDAPQILTDRQIIGEAILDQLALNWEYRVATQCTSGSNCASYTTVASAWNTDNATPITDIDTAIDNVLNVTGIRPNSIIFGNNTWKSLKRHADIISGLFGNSAVGQARVPTLEGIKALFGLERAIVGGTVYNTAAENQTATLSALWNDICLVYYAPLTARADKPSFMYSFNWNKIPGMNRQVQIFDEPKKGAEEVQVGYYQDEKITASALGFLITGCNSSQ